MTTHWHLSRRALGGPPSGESVFGEHDGRPCALRNKRACAHRLGRELARGTLARRRRRRSGTRRVPLEAGRAGRGWRRSPRGVSAATSEARARTPGSTVTIVRPAPTRHHDRLRRPLGAEAGDRHALALEALGGRTRRRGRCPAARRARSCSPRRAAATAVMAPPPGERMSSPAKRSSPGGGQELQTDEGEVQEGRGGDREFDAQHGCEGIR